MRLRTWIVLSLAIALAIGSSGCGKKQTADTSLADSTAFAANPTESTAANLTPQGNVPQPAPTPTPTPTPKPTSKPKATAPAPTPKAPAPAPGIAVPSGTALAVTLNGAISTETAKVGDPWTGVVKNDVVVDGKTVIPAGSTVEGTLTAAKPAVKGDRALLDLAITSVGVSGTSYAAHATTPAIEAGSTRARNLGAVAAGTGAGALVGGAMGGKKGALIGGLIGAATSGGAVAASKGYQVVLKEGTELTFNTTQSFNVKR
jgi:hypothetical protein